MSNYGRQQLKDDRQIGNNNFFGKDLTIKDFEIGTTLGTGTFGRVRQAYLKKDPHKKIYAMKILKKTTIVKLNQVDHIKSEKIILTQITHPFIVQVRITFQDRRYVYFLFEYVSGGELFSRLRKEGRFANDVALFYACEILLALQFLHQNNIVYRDLKPENLLIDNEGHIKLADFGFAKRLEDDRTFTLCGTPEYLAPEVVKGTKRTGYGKPVDWWSLGILLFEMLAGYPPFYDSDPVGIYKKILAGIIEFPRFFTLRTKDIIRKLLNPEVKYRLGTSNNASGDDIMLHKWLRGVDFKMIYKRRIPPPWIPELKHKADTACFDNYSDSEESAAELDSEHDHLFEDF